MSAVLDQTGPPRTDAPQLDMPPLPSPIRRPEQAASPEVPLLSIPPPANGRGPGQEALVGQLVQTVMERPLSPPCLFPSVADGMDPATKSPTADYDESKLSPAHSDAGDIQPVEAEPVEPVGLWLANPSPPAAAWAAARCPPRSPVTTSRPQTPAPGSCRAPQLFQWSTDHIQSRWGASIIEPLHLPVRVCVYSICRSAAQPQTHSSGRLTHCGSPTLQRLKIVSE
jgi:hypothetical protein